MNQNSEYQTIIVGAGLAGLAVATHLERKGRRTLILEKSDRIGGRLRTDSHKGFKLDHGFQVMLTAYPECQALLDYDSLNLGRFEPGSLLWDGKQFDLVADPFRRPGLAAETLRSNAGSLADKLRIARMAIKLSTRSLQDIYADEDSESLRSLKARGFSDSMIEGFLRPFLKGIFLEPDLVTSSRMLDFVFKCFGKGHAALPAGGMAEIPKQLAERLLLTTILLDQGVIRIGQNFVETVSGERFEADNIVLATDMSSAASLNASIPNRGWNQTACYYFRAPQSPLPRPMIALNASGKGFIQNISVPSDVSPGYAPEGQTLICVSTSCDKDYDPSEIKAELSDWFGTATDSFNFLKRYKIPQALPRQLPGDLPFESAPLRDSSGIWICGDHRFSSSIEGALKSGRRVAEAILQNTLQHA